MMGDQKIEKVLLDRISINDHSRTTGARDRYRDCVQIYRNLSPFPAAPILSDLHEGGLADFFPRAPGSACFHLLTSRTTKGLTCIHHRVNNPMYLTLTTLLYFSSSVSTGSYSQELVVSRVPSRICQVASSGEDKNKRAFYRASYLEVGPGENKLSSIRNDRVILRNMPSLLYVILRAAIGFKYSTLFARGSHRRTWSHRWSRIR